MVKARVPQRGQGGFTYLGLLLAVALAGTALAAAGTLWSTTAQREKEAELLFVGEQMRLAIGAYLDKAPAGQPNVFPMSLDQLLEDKRWPTKRRHLRKVFVDPMTGRSEWGIVAAPNGGVMGVYSLSEGVPLKREGFAADHSEFGDAQDYRGWRFIYVPGTPATRNTSAP